MNPPYPSEITAFEPPSPSEFPMIFRGGGGGMDIFWNHTFPDVIMALLFYPIAYLFLPAKRQSTHINFTATPTGNSPIPVNRNGVS